MATNLFTCLLHLYLHKTINSTWREISSVHCPAKKAGLCTFEFVVQSIFFYLHQNGCISLNIVTQLLLNQKDWEQYLGTDIRLTPRNNHDWKICTQNHMQSLGPLVTNTGLGETVWIQSSAGIWNKVEIQRTVPSWWDGAWALQADERQKLQIFLLCTFYAFQFLNHFMLLAWITEFKFQIILKQITSFNKPNLK